LKLEVAVTDISPSRKELTIEVPAEQVKAEYEKAYEAYSRHVKVPGFRPGRVPRSVIRQRFSKDLRGEVLSNLVPHALSHAVSDHQIRAIGEPEIDPEQITLAEDAPLRFTAGFEVIPDFELKDYKGLNLTRRVVKVTDENIAQMIEYWRDSAAEFVPVEDRPSQLGDIVSVNLVGKYVEPAEEEDLQTDDLQIELGADGVQAEFNDNLTGVRSGDTREFRVVYPADFSSKGLAGKTLDFTASVVAVRIKELPELDDELAKQFGPYEGVEDMRGKIRERLEQDSANRTEERLNNDLVSAILADYNFEIPAKLFQKQREARSQNFIHRLINSGLPMEQLMKVDVKKELKRIEHLVGRELRSSMIFERVGEAEGVQVTEEEIQQEIARRAAAAGISPAEMTDRLTKDDALSSIETSLFYDKTLKQILATAVVTEQEVTAEEAAEYDERANSIGEDTETTDDEAPATEGAPAE
jgi:trigger factor